MDICPISYSDVDAWMARTNTDVLPEEVEMIMTMDDAFMLEISKEQKNRTPEKGSK